DLDGMSQLMERLRGSGFRLVILLDEFERITNNPKFPLEFFAFLRFLANHYDVAYITSSSRDLQSLCHSEAISDSPFFNIFSSLRLSVFEPGEARELLRAPVRAGRASLEPYAEQAIALAGRFPFFLQRVCWHVFEAAESGVGAVDFEAIR